jgi:hypothetical protein
MSAGVLSGYLSHVPHNLSTLKLLRPSESYGILFKSLLDGNKPRVEKLLGAQSSETAKNLLTALLTVFAPKGVTIRTGQIVGSFIIVNGTINLFSTFSARDKAAAEPTLVYGGGDDTRK